MGSLLGFRPPQFSEEVAWLPPWLQPPEASVQRVEVEIEEMQLLEQSISTTTREYGNSSSRDDGRYKSCHLFLSGEDNSPMNFSSSSNKAVHFHLHMSLNGDSETSFSPLLGNSQAERFEFNQPLPMRQLQTKAIPEEKANTYEVDCDAGNDYLVPNSEREKSKMLGCQSISINKDKGTKPEENARVLKVADISDAVELSVAASEALIIHEVVKNGPTTELWPASAVLEAALRVKQARLEGFEETVNCSIEGSSEIDNLSDLDESTMADAYEDVGLTFTDQGDMCGYSSVVSQVKDSYASVVSQVKDSYGSVSQVKDSYASENCTSDGKQKCKKPGILEVESDDISTKQQTKDIEKIDTRLERYLVLESDKQHIDDASLDLENINLSCDADPMLHWSVEGCNLFTTEVDLQKVNFAMGDVISSQATVISSLQEKDDCMKNIVPDRFQSRWFGGWTWKKEVNVSAATDHKNERRIPEPFVGETSFLSESADNAPDENSFVQNRDKRSKIVSESSVDVEFIHNKANEGILLSKDDAISPSLSFLDPLCSVVPCSITSENPCYAVDRVNAEKCFNPTPEAVDILNRTSIQSTEFVHGEGKAASKITAEGSPTNTIRRQVTSLRTYSMLSSRHGAYLERVSTRGRLFPMKCDLNLLSSVRQSPATDLVNEANNNDKMAIREAELPINMQEKMDSPCSIARGEVSKCFSLDISGEENPEQTVAPEKNVEPLQSKCFQKTEYNCRNSIVPRRKRVRFSEAESSLPQIKRFQMQQTRDRNCSISKTGKMWLKSSNLQPHEGKRCLMKRMLFRNINFLLTGLSVEKEKQIEGLIRKNGGMVLYDIPSPKSRVKRGSSIKSQPFPVILCFRKLQTTKFLYGCAVNAFILKVKWVTDSIAAGSVLPPDKYMILRKPAGQNCMYSMGKSVRCSNFIFDRLGIMLHGKHNFCTKMAKVIKHGGGLVFKTLHWLVQSLDAGKVCMGVIVTEDENLVSRHLKQCAAEREIPMMPLGWIVNSLYAGRILSSTSTGNNHLLPLLPLKLQDAPVSMEMSEEI